MPNGRIDFDLYYRLLADQNHVAAAPVAEVPGELTPAPEPVPGPQPAPQVAAVPDPPKIELHAKGAKVYHQHDTLVVQARIDRDGFVYCYYQDAQGDVSRVFPNRFQPDAFVHAASPFEIPPGNPKPFSIQFDKPNTKEAIACVGSALELGVKLPEALKKQDLEPLPVANIQEVIDKFQAVSGGHMSEEALIVEVN